MESIFKNQIVLFKIKTHLTAAYVKDLVIKTKKELEHYQDYQGVEIDLSQAHNIDSMGITFLIGVYKTVSAEGKTFKVLGVSDAMLQLFAIMKLDEIFEIEKA